MSSVQYGDNTIEYTFLEKEGLKSHYITVQKREGVILKGKAIPLEHANKLILKKAKWILDKLELVKFINEEDIVTGSRIQYLGRKYYVELIINEELKEITIDFTESKFVLYLPRSLNTQLSLKEAFNAYQKEKAIEKIKPRIKKWSKTTGLSFTDIKFRKLDKRWGSCTPSNTIIINIDAIKLPFSLIDYLIVHELVHTKIKSHSKEFWAELSKHIPNWKELDEKMYGMKM
ncbi:M48 family metallopeptidase [Flavobacterium sp. ACAM 123]|uniref:M48 family metallopeptidase n=1 Tax=Flavobacterium sp. ACAM 123 TaxID=1189620 RepID=UPI000308E4B9|nr:SprT family zinc-dependent metalloprotease [Flavobacterium sp. ACAM 123]